MKASIGAYCVVFLSGAAGGVLASTLLRADAEEAAGTAAPAAAAVVSGSALTAHGARGGTVDGSERLEARILELENRLAALEAAITVDNDMTTDPGVDARAAGAREDRTLAQFRANPRDAMIEAGFLPGRAEYLADRLEELQYRNLEQSYARRRGTGEPVPAGSRTGDPLRVIRDEVTGEEYDRLLLALGQTNRVAVRDVLSTSPAEQADLRVGDIIYAYDGRRIYSLGDLRRSTFESDAGRTVPLEIIRDGAPVIVYVPGGPLGVSVQAHREAP